MEILPYQIRRVTLSCSFSKHYSDRRFGLHDLSSESHNPSMSDRTAYDVFPTGDFFPLETATGRFSAEVRPGLGEPRPTSRGRLATPRRTWRITTTVRLSPGRAKMRRFSGSIPVERIPVEKIPVGRTPNAFQRRISSSSLPHQRAETLRRSWQLFARRHSVDRHSADGFRAVNHWWAPYDPVCSKGRWDS